MITFFKIIIYQPLFNLLVLIYQYASFNDFGIAIVILTILIRLILYPLFYYSLKNQAIMQKLQPEIQQIQHSHKDNKEKKAQALLEIYKTHKVNPFSGFLIILIQLPILISLYQIFFKGLSPEMLQNVYSFLSAPGTVNYIFLGLIDLQKQNIMVVGLAAILQYLQSRLSLPKTTSDARSRRLNQFMLLTGPIITLFIFSKLPAALSLYWVVTTIFSIVQQVIINNKLKHGFKPNGTENIANAGV